MAANGDACHATTEDAGNRCRTADGRILPATHITRNLHRWQLPGMARRRLLPLLDYHWRPPTRPVGTRDIGPRTSVPGADRHEPHQNGNTESARLRRKCNAMSKMQR